MTENKKQEVDKETVQKLREQRKIKKRIQSKEKEKFKKYIQKTKRTAIICAKECVRLLEKERNHEIKRRTELFKTRNCLGGIQLLQTDKNIITIKLIKGFLTLEQLKKLYPEYLESEYYCYAEYNQSASLHIVQNFISDANCLSSVKTVILEDEIYDLTIWNNILEQLNKCGKIFTKIIKLKNADKKYKTYVV